MGNMEVVSGQSANDLAAYCAQR